MKNTIDKIIGDSVKYGESIGSNCLIYRDGKEIYSGFFGFADRENGTPMTRNTIFRLFSLSKPITSSAAMILIDKGLLRPDDPVSKYISEFSELTYTDDNDEIHTYDGELKISHLLNMTSGIPYAHNWCKSVCASARLFDEIIENQKTGSELTTLEICRKAADIPLMFRPGEKWDYGISADIMGGIIEVISGMSYGEFLRKNIFEPLGMDDTGFYVPPEKLNRFAALYSWQENGLERDNGNYLGLTDYKNAPGFESGGAGLVSTIDDYSKFARMLANRGELNGIRLFSDETFRFMTTPQLDKRQLSGMWDRLDGYNYGNFMRILVDPEIARNKTVKGEFGWDGWTGTFFAADADSRTVVLYFTQICGAGTTKQAELICEEVFKNI